MKQQNHTDHPGYIHPKQDFQVERIAFFSDAIFAIAITLLIIEFKVPAIEKGTSYVQAIGEILELKYNLFSLLLSFYLIASYWIKHHFLFRHIRDYNRVTVVANMFTLLPIIFFPFTTAYFAESIRYNNVMILGLRVFLANHLLANLSIYIFYWLTFVKHKTLTFPLETVERKKFRSKTLISVFILLSGLLLSFVTTNMKMIFWVLSVAMAIQSISRRWYAGYGRSSNQM